MSVCTSRHPDNVTKDEKKFCFLKSDLVVSIIPPASASAAAALIVAAAAAAAASIQQSINTIQQNSFAGFDYLT